MKNESKTLKIFVLNAIDFIAFGFELFKQGTCDERIKGIYRVEECSDIKGYTKIEAANMLHISVRQFDRHIQLGKICKGRKIRGFTALRWDKDYIDKLSTTKYS